eukprot:7290237-Pyramimonas_sp.AAC.1
MSEGHQLLSSDPLYGGSIKQKKVGVYSFPCANNPSTHSVYSVAEESFGDGIWVIAEIIFHAKPICIKGSPDQFVSDPPQM